MNDPADILSIEDEQVKFFPSYPDPGAMNMFMPLLNVMKECIRNRPVAFAGEIERKLNEQYPNAISDHKLISFTEYVYLARLRGIPIRFSQSHGEPVYMWF